MGCLKGNNKGLTLIERVKNWLKGNNKGFTLIEIVTVLGVTSVMAAVLTPMTTTYIGEAKVRRAAVDSATIAMAVMEFEKDVQEWPIWPTAATASSHEGFYKVVSSEGADAVVNSDGEPGALFNIGATAGDMGSIEDMLLFNKDSAGGELWPRTGQKAWDGPYMKKIGDDPWGNRYYLTAEWLQNASFTVGGTKEKAVFIISAGQMR